MYLNSRLPYNLNNIVVFAYSITELGGGAYKNSCVWFCAQMANNNFESWIYLANSILPTNNMKLSDKHPAFQKPINFMHTIQIKVQDRYCGVLGPQGEQKYKIKR